MADSTPSLDSTRIRHLAGIARVEAEIYAVTRRSLRVWLPTVEAAVLYGRAPAPKTPLLAAAEDETPVTSINPGAAESARGAWNERVEEILAVIGAAWLLHYRATTASRAQEVTRRDAYLARVRDRLRAIPDRIFGLVNDAVDDGTRRGLGLRELAKLVRQALRSTNPEYQNRAQSIARTEGVAVFNGSRQTGHEVVTRETGQTFTKTWLSQRDMRVRPTHGIASGQRVAANAKFSVGGFAADYPGDPSLPPHEAIGCRCTVLYSGSVVATIGEPMNAESLVAGILAAFDADGALPNGWRGVMAPLGRPTGDGRQLNVPEGGLRCRQMPITFDWAPRREGGHDGAVMAGRIDRAWDGGDGFLWGEGALDLNGAAGQEYARQLAEGFTYTVSVDPDEVTFEQWFMSPEGEQASYNEAVMVGDGEETLKEGYSVLDVMTDWRLAGVTAVQIPAFDEARIEPVYGYESPEDVKPCGPGQHKMPDGSCMDDADMPGGDESVPDNTGGSMIAMRVNEPRRYVYGEDGEPWAGSLSAADLHVTLHYLGDAADLTDESAVNAARFAASEAAFAVGVTDTIRVAGYGTLGDKGANVLFLNGDSIERAHRAADSMLDAFGREAYAEPHRPFLAHMTLAYGGEPADFAEFAAQLVGQEMTVHGVDFVYGARNDFYPIAVENDAVVAAVTGKLSYPIHPERKRKWDGHAARQRVAKWASSDGSGDPATIDKKKFQGAFLWMGEPNTGNSLDGGATFAAATWNVEDAKAGFVDIVDGTPYIIANAIIGLAGGHGIQAMKVPGPTKKVLLGKLRTLYAKAARVFSDWPEFPFEKTAALVATTEGALVASMGQTFLIENFADPKLTGPTPLTVDENGRVFGHVATWGACYMSLGAGSDKPCILIPHTETDYERFHLHGARLVDGTILPVGAITFGDGHRSAGGLRASTKLYADVATMAAKVRAGEDEFGVWVSGEVLDAFRDRADDLLLSPLSGHWESDLDVGGNLEMLAAHVVVVPGFKVPRLVATLGDDSEVVAFQASGPFTFLDRSAELFDAAVEAGEIVPGGTRDDGVVLYDDVLVAAISADRKAQRALRRLAVDPDSRATDALTRLGVRS